MLYLIIILDAILLRLYTKKRNKILKYILGLFGIALILIYLYLLNFEMTINTEVPSIMALPFALLRFFHILIAFDFIFKIRPSTMSTKKKKWTNIDWFFEGE
jgi:membrane-bound ClpP family serine protease